MNQEEVRDLHFLTRDRSVSGSPSDARGVPLPRRRWKTRLLLPLAIVGITLGILGSSARDMLLPVTEVRVVPVVAKDGEAGPTQSGVIVQAPGWVEADPFPVAVSALADGVVQEVLALEGDRVEAGQIVCHMIDDDARIALTQAEAHLSEEQSRLASAYARLKEAEQNWQHPIELQRAVDATRAQLAEKKAELDRWPAELARENALAVSLKADFDRIDRLYQSSRASEIEHIHARQAYEMQQAEVEKTRLRKPIIEAQIATIEAERRAAEQQRELRIADTRLLADANAAVSLAEALVARAQAMRDDAALRLSRMEVRSPVAGIVMSRQAEPGAKLMLSMDHPQSAQAVRLYDPEKLQVRVDVPLADAAKIGVGQQTEVIVDVLPDRVFAGRISRVVHHADVQKNTLQVKVAIEDPIAELKPEMLARARFLGATSPTKRGAADGACRLLVPRRAVHSGNDGTFVWLADEVAHVARRARVSMVADATGGSVCLTEGVRQGDRVIVDAPSDFEDGDRIRIVGEAKEAGDGDD